MVKVGGLAVCRRGIIGRVTRIKDGVYYGERWDTGARWQTVEPREVDGEQIARMLDRVYVKGRDAGWSEGYVEGAKCTPPADEPWTGNEIYYGTVVVGNTGGLE